MPRRATRWLVLVLAAWGLAQNPVAAQVARPGSPGLGDPYFPQMGNGGYDVQHYTIEMTIDVARNTVTATTAIAARATQHLSAFTLDFTGPPISRLEVDGTGARYDRTGGELTITPPAHLSEGTAFVTVAYAGAPGHGGEGPFGGGWRTGDDEIFVLGEPSGAETWYPVNGHPSDKATYTLRITVPKPYDVASSGRLLRITDDGDRRTFLWETRDPVASYLVALHISPTWTRRRPSGREASRFATISPTQSRHRTALPSIGCPP